MKTSMEATFVGASMNPNVLRRNPLPEIIFLGRSNVGKSSLINCLVNRKKLARTSSTPGKTRLFFFYEVDQKFLFVDPPGYGYAKVSQSLRGRWMKEMERYLRKAEMLLGVVLIMDIRHAPTAIDRDMALWLAESRIPAIYALNKADKLSRKQRIEALNRISGELDFDGAGEIVPFSSQSKDGRDELWRILNNWMEGDRNGE
ncbi:YihA family ribosome biogenesis GTP-binding protein [candidate division LCP-89 bacterium B3_LCP]|uniref:Probable GTP-binding protein EngB n=1 Tax=candidate division LCP-89 bacterium B3_LCP TaxID=2012998 RepID=A0A532V3T3_UNCL8|nr:MAG: YihA family ribosome biogenesis GTP-binding protein [candidate division LCP-89 bacterium B3_LCP]